MDVVSHPLLPLALTGSRWFLSLTTGCQKPKSLSHCMEEHIPPADCWQGKKENFCWVTSQKPGHIFYQNFITNNTYYQYVSYLILSSKHIHFVPPSSGHNAWIIEEKEKRLGRKGEEGNKTQANEDTSGIICSASLTAKHTVTKSLTHFVAVSITLQQTFNEYVLPFTKWNHG